MLKIINDELPKEYERIILMEYYDFFNKLYGLYNLLGVKRFTADPHKILATDLKDQAFSNALAAYKSIEKPDIEFLCYGPDELITAMARMHVIPDESVQIVDIIYLDYPLAQEKQQIITKLLVAMEKYAQMLNCPIVYYEVPKNDHISEDIALLNGYSVSINTQNYPTNVFKKSLLVRGYDGQNIKRCQN